MNTMRYSYSEWINSFIGEIQVYECRGCNYTDNIGVYCPNCSKEDYEKFNNEKNKRLRNFFNSNEFKNLIK